MPTKEKLNCKNIYHIAFSYCLKLGPVNFARLLKYFGSAEKAWNAGSSNLLEAGLTRGMVDEIKKVREEISLSSVLGKLEKIGAYTLTPESNAYPPVLKEIYDPPYCLYIRGQLLEEDHAALAVVGSRKVTEYGRASTKNLVSGAVRNNLTIVSGLALGTDAKAHKSALEAGGRTIAVLASGIDNITPHSNIGLARSILQKESGALVSECPLGHRPRKQSFPVRNRIISGLSLGTLVVEAGEKSGTMHTAKSCLDQGRDVFAVPGSIFSPQSAGTHMLIQQGAKLVHSIEDVIDELSLEQKKMQLTSRRILPENKKEKVVLTLLEESGALSLDALAEKTEKDAGELLSVLTELEMKGGVKLGSGGKYRIADS